MLENSIIFDGICLSDFGISTNMEKKTCETVITTRRNLINSNLGINKDILCRCALCTILGIFTFKLWLRHKLSAQLVLKH